MPGRPSPRFRRPRATSLNIWPTSPSEGIDDGFPAVRVGRVGRLCYTKIAKGKWRSILVDTRVPQAGPKNPERAHR